MVSQPQQYHRPKLLTVPIAWSSSTDGGLSDTYHNTENPPYGCLQRRGVFMGQNFQTVLCSLVIFPTYNLETLLAHIYWIWHYKHKLFNRLLCFSTSLFKKNHLQLWISSSSLDKNLDTPAYFSVAYKVWHFCIYSGSGYLPKQDWEALWLVKAPIHKFRGGAWYCSRLLQILRYFSLIVNKKQLEGYVQQHLCLSLSLSYTDTHTKHTYTQIHSHVSTAVCCVA